MRSMRQRTATSYRLLGVAAIASAHLFVQSSRADSVCCASNRCAEEGARLSRFRVRQAGRARRRDRCGHQNPGGGRRPQDSRRCAGDRSRRCHFLLPLFIDAHVHLSPRRPAQIGMAIESTASCGFPAEQALYGAHYARRRRCFAGIADHGARDSGSTEAILHSACAMPSTPDRFRARACWLAN